MKVYHALNITTCSDCLIIEVPDDIAEMVEARVMEKMEELGYKLRNRINSPGVNKLKNIGKAAQDLIEKAADSLITEMFQNMGADIKKGPKHH